MRNVVRQGPFVLLWVGGLFSLLGSWALYSIAPVFILDETGSVFLAGLVWAVIALPSIVLGPIAGVYVDRLDRLRILIWGYDVQGAAALVLLLTDDAAAMWVVMGVLVVFASCGAMVVPAENAILPGLVHEDDLHIANTLNAMNDNLARIAGPPIGAAAYVWFGIHGVATINIVLFFTAATCVALASHKVGRAIRQPSPSAGPVSREPFRISLAIGATSIRRHHILAIVVVILALLAWADGPASAMFAPFIASTLGKGVEGVGIFNAVRGVAGLLGGVVIGPTHIGIHTTLTTLLQRHSEDRYRGRVFALTGTVTATLFLAGTLVGSVVGATTSPALVIAGTGLLLCCTSIVARTRLPAALTQTSKSRVAE